MKRLLIILCAFCILFAGGGRAQTVVINSYRFNTFTGVLDPYTTNLRVAYSVSRRLLGSYSGSLFQVRRSSDNATQDIGYGADGWADTTALASFVGSNSGYVSIIYDQSGGGYHLRQPTSGNQMRIVGSGTNDVLATRLTLYNSSGTESVGYYSDTFTTYSGTTLSAFGRGLSATVGNRRFVSVVLDGGNDFTASTTALMIGTAASNLYWSSYRVSGYGTINTPSNADGLISCIFDATNRKLRDGTNTDTTASTASFSINRALVGMYTSAAFLNSLNSKFAEVMLWTSDQTSNEAAIRAALTY